MGKTSNSNIKTGEIVMSAIKKLMRNTGWTARTIVKFIKMEYRILDPKISRKVSRALKRGVRLGLLQMESGRYRLNKMSRLARPMNSHQMCLRRRGKKHNRIRPLHIWSCTSSSNSGCTYARRRRS
ncbi:uncharacterized protein LOC131853386 [Achroia grisella]|uniref:uncharacterized protein LOC131853386 n=1 Tax=Achroia grisella TaxID=688607 RepID=UPI0027D2580B|nr:uncharacterized protein LOC131853386 [Achroia grisella]